LEAIATLGLTAPVSLVNDALLGLLAGTAEGWGVAVVSGTGCNCWGWDKTRQRQGQVTGGGSLMGEGAGATELMMRAIQAVAHEWTRRGPATQLTPALLRFTGARDLPEFLHDVMTGRLALPVRAAPLVFDVAAAGDAVARDVIRWAGRELGEIVNAVVRQLQFETAAFDVVMVGSLFNGGALLIEPMRETVLAFAPHARFVRLSAPPVVGAALLGMEQAGLTGPRERLIQSTQQLLNENGK
jgi:N-acetylglucosamine kinase-like BadF-type ATPase